MHRRTTSRPLRVGALLVAVLVLATLTAAVRSTPAVAVVGDCTPGAAWPANRADLASQVVSLINDHRTSMGLVALQVSPTLTNAAVWKARHMAEYQYMQHDDPAPPVARTVGDRLAACGYPVGSVGWGENIAYGYQTPSAVVQAWLNSSGHRANIENSSYRATGVGAAAAANGYIYWSQEFGTYVDSGSGGGGTGAPTVSLTSGPASSTTSTSASFAWTTTGTVTSTTCSLDGAAAVACSSPKSYTGLAVGTHTFRVSVANSGGSSGASYTWSVTSASPSAPTVSLTSKPASSTTSTSASFAWTTTGTVNSTTCSLDGAAAVACSSPKSYTGLAVGTHTFRVTVSNGSGSTTASASWTVTSSSTSGAPTVHITSVTRSYATRGVTFTWSTTGTVTSTTCSLDYGTPVACSSPKSYTGLASGTHVFAVTVSSSYGSARSTYTFTA